MRKRPSREHPLPQLGRVGEVPRIAVGVPALHHAVLDDDLHAQLAGPVDERLEHLFGVAEVLGHGPARVPPHERADRRAAEQRGGLQAAADVVVDRLPLVGVGVQVVVVEGERRQLEAVLGEQRAGGVGLGVAEALDGEVGGGERAVAEVGPGGHLERLVPVGGGPFAQLGQGAPRQAGGDEAELHERISSQVWPPAERRTASVMAAARAPSAKVGRPSTAAASPARTAR